VGFCRGRAVTGLVEPDALCPTISFAKVLPCGQASVQDALGYSDGGCPEPIETTTEPWKLSAVNIRRPSIMV
jgi:hypothetical protein